MELNLLVMLGIPAIAGVIFLIVLNLQEKKRNTY